MKKNKAGTDFYFSKNKNSFWVGDVMAGMQLSICRQGDMQSYTYLSIISKTIENTLQE